MTEETAQIVTAVVTTGGTLAGLIIKAIFQLRGILRWQEQHDEIDSEHRKLTADHGKELLDHNLRLRDLENKAA